VTISPQPVGSDRWEDFFGNETCFFSIESLHDHLDIQARSIVEVQEPKYLASSDSPAWEDVVEHLRRAEDEEARRACQFTLDSHYVERKRQARDYAELSFEPKRSLREAISDLSRRIAQDFQYDTTATHVHTPTAEVFEKRRGVCQDFAHLQISCLRSLGLAARYVSGYLFTDPPPGQAKLVGGDASHAWVSVFCPKWGWIDIDPTNNQLVGTRYVTLAWGRDYGDVCPVKGVLIGSGQQTMEVSVDVSVVGNHSFGRTAS
jgi:transglutaminase-like putative cysteine protease